MKKLMYLAALCAVVFMIVPSANAQHSYPKDAPNGGNIKGIDPGTNAQHSGGLVDHTDSYVRENPCPPCPPVYHPITQPKRTVVSKSGDVIVNNYLSCPPSCEPMYPPNGESPQTVSYPTYDTSDEMLSRGGLLLWLVLLTVAIAFIAGFLWNRRNSDTHHHTRIIHHHGPNNYYYGGGNGPNPPRPKSSPAATEEKTVD